MGRLFDGIGHYRSFGLFIDSVFLVGFMLIFVHKGVDAALLNRFLVTVKGVSG